MQKIFGCTHDNTPQVFKTWEVFRKTELIFGWNVGLKQNLPSLKDLAGFITQRWGFSAFVVKFPAIISASVREHPLGPY